MRYKFFAVSLCAGCIAAAVCASGTDENAASLKGTYKRGAAGKPDELTLDLAPTDAAGRYDAVFTCQWKNKPEKFVGFLEGDIGNGAVSGQASKGKRTWVFEGTSTNSTISCRHFEVKGDKKQPTGSFQLSRN